VFPGSVRSARGTAKVLRRWTTHAPSFSLAAAVPLYPRELATDEAQGLYDPREMEIGTSIHHPADNVQSIPVVHR
jgi:hypothetical protein